jgi:hypothetical protein
MTTRSVSARTKFELVKANDGIHKYVGIFHDGSNVKHISFGAVGYDDMTMHNNPLRKKQYLARHQPNEDWNDPQTRGALSRWLLWETSNLQTNLQRFRKRFSLD